MSEPFWLLVVALFLHGIVGLGNLIYALMSASAGGGGSGEALQFAPIRSVEDFLLSSARFQIPSKDLQKWTRRILSNLLYYQSNYFLIIAIIFTLVGCMHPQDMILGLCALSAGGGVWYAATTSTPAAVQFKKDHPIFALLIIIVVAYMLIHMMGSIIVLLYGFAAPMLLVFVHASLRTRNLQSKLNEKMEALGFKASPMGMLFDALGLELEVISFRIE